MVVSFAAMAFAGPETLIENSDDVLATLGTDVLRVALGQAAGDRRADLCGGLDPDDHPADGPDLAVHGLQGRGPKRFGNIHPRYLTSSTSTIWMGVLSIAWYVALTIISEDILFDSIAALGLMIAFYYGITGFACPIYYRRELFKSTKNAIMVGLAPLLGGLILAWVFIKSASTWPTRRTPSRATPGSGWGRRWSSASASSCSA
jgi:hypothetical protein